MYCINFQRSSPGIDYNRSNHSQAVFDKKVERQSQLKMRDDETLNQSGYKPKSELSDYGINENGTKNNVSLKIHQKDQKRQNRELHEEQMHKFYEHSTATPIIHTPEKSKRFIPRNYYPSTSEMMSRFEKEQRQQEIDKANYLDLSTIPFPAIRKSNSLTRKATGLKKFTKNGQYEGARRYQHSEHAEEKKDDMSGFSSSRTNELDHSVWISPSRSSGDNREQLVFPTSIIQKEGNDNISFSNEVQFSSTSLSNQRLRDELKKCCRMLDMERNKNLTLQQKLQHTECQLKAIEGTKPAEEDSRQIQKLEEEVAYCRREFKKERKKRQKFEDELQKTRLENLRYAKQMDVLIFEYIPNVAPKFKDIGPVNYTINESFNYIGSYQLGEILGEGYYGSVRSGSHTKRHQRFAIKILKKININGFKDLKHIAIEIHVLKTYRHPNIIHLEEVVHAADNIYMVTEFCSMDLHKYYSEIGLTIESARQVVFGILHPLHHLHLHGICHLDLKPENILLTESLDSHNATHKHVRICDFGLVNMARRSDENKDVIREGYVCGTPGFYAPEMILQDRFEGRSADMVSARI
jgi:hypothetical protein